MWRLGPPTSLTDQERALDLPTGIFSVKILLPDDPVLRQGDKHQPAQRLYFYIFLST